MILNKKNPEHLCSKSNYQLSHPEKPENWVQADGSVLLIDEIDKANAELPNALLEIMANNAINIPWLKTTIGGKDRVPPLMIITTNEERELPPAFIRRCLVLHLTLPKKDEELRQWLVQRGQLHYGAECSKNVMQEAAEQLIEDRKRAKDNGIIPPGQAEYLDMLRALALLGESEKEQLNMLENIHKFALCKYPVMYED